jgi:hypothetical protein
MNESKAPKAMHRRSIEHRTWMHEDGVLEIEGRLIDSKAYDSTIGFNRPLPAGEAVHDMTIRIRLGCDGLIQEIRLQMDSTPFDICPEIIQRFETLRGVSMGKGWNALLSERFAGAGGCRHLIDLLRGMATVAFQSLSRGGWSEPALESFTDSCHAFRQGSPVMMRLAADLKKSEKQQDD